MSKSGQLALFTGDYLKTNDLTLGILFFGFSIVGFRYRRSFHLLEKYFEAYLLLTDLLRLLLI